MNGPGLADAKGAASLAGGMQIADVRIIEGLAHRVRCERIGGRKPAGR